MLEQNEGHYAPKILESGCYQPKTNIKNYVIFCTTILLSFLFFSLPSKKGELKRERKVKNITYSIHLLKFLGEYSYKKNG